MKQHFSPKARVWQATAFPGAREAVISSVLVGGERPAPTGKTPDPERSEREAQRRAATKCRRLCVANQLDRLWTLTFAVEPADEREVVRHVAAFMKACNAKYRGWKYLYVIERGSELGRLHVHFATNRFVPKASIQALWNHGFVDARRLGNSGNSGSRNAAKYLSKYVTKSGGNSGRPKHARRFTPGHGLVLDRVAAQYVDLLDAEAFILQAMKGKPPDHVWASADAQDWRGPPCMVLFWT